MNPNELWAEIEASANPGVLVKRCADLREWVEIGGFIPDACDADACVDSARAMLDAEGRTKSDVLAARALLDLGIAVWTARTSGGVR